MDNERRNDEEQPARPAEVKDEHQDARPTPDKETTNQADESEVMADEAINDRFQATDN